MKLSEWIESVGGRARAAAKLDMTPEAIHYWLAGKNTPTFKTIFRIIELSGGRVTIKDILEETKVKTRTAGGAPVIRPGRRHV